MACTCRSYNSPQPHQASPKVILNTPIWTHSDRRTVPVDACIAPVILARWDAQIWTVSCCCGHNGVLPRHVVVDRTDRKAAEAVIAGLGVQMPVRAWELV